MPTITKLLSTGFKDTDQLHFTREKNMVYTFEKQLFIFSVQLHNILNSLFYHSQNLSSRNFLIQLEVLLYSEELAS